MKHKVRFWSLTVLAVLALVFAALFVMSRIGKKKVVFFYPDLKYKTLLSETRALDFHSSDYNYEEKLAEEYFLGPIHYQMDLPLSESISLRDAWLATSENGAKVLILNFDSGFKKLARSRMREFELMFRAFLKTLKVNTSVSKVYVLERSHKIKLAIGDYQLYYALRVR